MKRIWSVCLIVMFTWLVAPLNRVGAEEFSNVLSFEELKVQVMPEFSYHPEDKKKEKPTLLVGYHGSLMNESDKPQKGVIAIPLPVKEKNFRIGFVADYNRDGTEMVEIEYELDPKTGVLTWETNEEIQPGELYKFVIDYYTDQIVAKAEDKKLSYTFTSFADIGLVSLTILEPLKSESFSISPKAETHQQNPYGMNMFMYQMQGLKAKDKKSFEIKYSRAEKTPTMDIINEMAGEGAKAAAPVKDNKTIATSLIVGVVGGASIMFGSVLVFLLRKKKPLKQSKKVVPDHTDKIKRLRGMLLEGAITEEEYEELLKRLGA